MIRLKPRRWRAPSIDTRASPESRSPLPENAIVSQRLVSSGQLVTDLEPLADLIDPKSIYVEAAVPVDDISLVRPGMAATVTSPLDPGVDFPARVAALSPNFTPGRRDFSRAPGADRRPDNQRSGGSGGDPGDDQKRARRDRDPGCGAVSGRRQQHLLRIRRRSPTAWRIAPPSTVGIRNPSASPNHLRARTGATRYHVGRLCALRRASGESGGRAKLNRANSSLALCAVIAASILGAHPGPLDSQRGVPARCSSIARSCWPTAAICRPSRCWSRSRGRWRKPPTA